MQHSYSHSGRAGSNAAFCRVDAKSGTVSQFDPSNGSAIFAAAAARSPLSVFASGTKHQQQSAPDQRASNNKNNTNTLLPALSATNHLSVAGAVESQPRVFTGRRRNPHMGVFTSEGSVLRPPWSECAPGLPVASTARDTYNGGGNNGGSGNAAEEQLRAQLTALQATRRKQQGCGARDLKLTTIENTKKRLATLGERHVALDAQGNRMLGREHLAPTVDEIGQDKPQNQKSSTALHTGGSRTRLEPFLVYEDEVAHLPAVPTVGITYTGARPEDRKAIIFPWDRPRVGADGAGKLARREARRLVTQRRLEFAEQFLPEVCSGVTTEMSRRVADQFQRGGVTPSGGGNANGASSSSGAAASAAAAAASSGSYMRGQPQPLALGALENAVLRPNNTVATAAASPNRKLLRVSLGGASGSSSQQTNAEQQQQQQKARKVSKAVQEIERRVQEICQTHEAGLRQHDQLMQIAVTTL